MNSFDPWILLLIMHDSISMPNFFLSTKLHVQFIKWNRDTFLSEQKDALCCENDHSFILKIPSIDLLNFVAEQQWLYNQKFG